MLNVKLETTGTEPIYFLDGTINENVDFTPIKPSAKNEIRVDCLGISRINSVGVKKWIKFFEDQKPNGTKLFFYRLPPVLIEQFNMIKNFGAGGTVVNAVIPFVCEDCGHENLLVKERSEVYGIGLDFVMWPCEKCKQPNLKFDDDPDEYLQFWK